MTNPTIAEDVETVRAMLELAVKSWDDDDWEPHDLERDLIRPLRLGLDAAVRLQAGLAAL